MAYSWLGTAFYALLALLVLEPVRLRDDTTPVVLLAHQPVMVEQARAAGADLQLSGHTHGGQLWPFDYAVRLDQPEVQGWSRHGDTQLYVTAGVGQWRPPMRIGARPEVTVVELRGP